MIWIRDNVLLATWLPYSNLIIIGNWFPLWMSLLGGMAWTLLPRLATRTAPSATHPPSRAPRGLQARRLLVVVFLQAVGWGAVIEPIWGSPPECHNQWQGDICVQTSIKSCTAACAATLLKLCGIEATEKEMAELCLTRRGTLSQGLYRGLKLKTAGTDWDVRIVHGPFDGLRSLHEPAILAAGIPGTGHVPAVYTEQYGWAPGDWHSVLFFGFSENGLVAMGDPTGGVGREHWSEEDLRFLWRGRGIRLVRRK